jgi:putative ABC transport system ATP-binding protein
VTTGPGAGAAALAAYDVVRTYELDGLSVPALRGVTIEVPHGDYLSIVGRSGSGKSTLMHLLAGLDRATEGTVHIGDQDITTMSDKALTKLRRRHIGFVFQSFNLLPTLSAEENVLLPLTIAGRKVDREGLDALLGRVGLSERRRHRPSELSGGQQQRVAIARALISEPTVLFADEPTGNLDSTAGAQVLDLLRDAVDLDGQTTVMVTHDPRAAARADRVLFLADGRIVADLVEPTEADVLAQMKAVSA